MYYYKLEKIARNLASVTDRHDPYLNQPDGCKCEMCESGDIRVINTAIKETWQVIEQMDEDVEGRDR